MKRLGIERYRRRRICGCPVCKNATSLTQLFASARRRARLREEVFPMIEIAPSLLSSDFARLGQQAQEALAGGATLLHVDVMDGHFVPNITIGPPVVASLRKVTKAPLDCHLMIERTNSLSPSRRLEPVGSACTRKHVSTFTAPCVSSRHMDVSRQWLSIRPRL